jgi:hypothetical protein
MSLIPNSSGQTSLPPALEPTGGNDTEIQASNNRPQPISFYRLIRDKLRNPVARPLCIEIYDWILRMSIDLFHLCFISFGVFSTNSSYCQAFSLGCTPMFPSIYFSLSVSVSEFFLAMTMPLDQSPYVPTSPINSIVLKIVYAARMNDERLSGANALSSITIVNNLGFFQTTMIYLISFRYISVFILRLGVALGKDFGPEFIKKEFLYAGKSVNE